MNETSKPLTSARVLADSKANGARLTTFEIEYPRIVLAELNVHCMLARSSSSTRAIPFARMLETLEGRPARFGENKAGMQDRGVDYNATIHGYAPEEWWDRAKGAAIWYAKGFAEAGFHKQISGRLLEPFQRMKTVITATEWANFYWLRNHEDADPTIQALAKAMWDAMQASKPVELEAGGLHLPYVDDEEKATYGRDDLLVMSAARSAAVSYRRVDYDIGKCREVYGKLVGADRKHASAFEHQGIAMQPSEFGVNNPGSPLTWETGITHADRDGVLWSAKLRGFVQHRKLIVGENYIGSNNEH